MPPPHTGLAAPLVTTPAATAAKSDCAPELREAAGRGYVREWGLFCDYTAATGQPALPTSVAALTGFFTALPARPATVARRVRAIAAAHRRTGYLLERPGTGPGAPPPAAVRRHPDPGLMVAACPTRGWPDGLWGRRDAFLIVLTEHCGHTHPGAREVHPDDLTVAMDDDGPVAVAGTPVPHGDDPRSCPACAVLRWLDVLGIADGLGRGSARMALTAARAPTAASSHERATGRAARWRSAPLLLPAIDQHGWHDDYRPMTTRAIRARLALAAQRATSDLAATDHDTPAQRTRSDEALPGGTRSELALDEVLTVLDGLAEDADALNARIQALLFDGRAVPGQR